MAIRSTLSVTILLVVLIYLMPSSLGQANVTTVAPLITTVNTTINATNITTTSAVVTTANRTVITTEAPRTSIFTTANLTSPTTTTTKTTTRAPTRKFDGLSFIGGMILTVGLTAIIYLVVTYMRRQKPVPYANLH